MFDNVVKPSTSGTYVEGIGDDVMIAFISLLVLIITSVLLVVKFKYLDGLSAIHPESQEDVNAARSHLQIDINEELSEGPENLEAGDNQHRFYSDRRCPVCLLDARHAVETNCGHLFCGRCIITYWQYGNWLGAVQCPVCRQIITLLMRDFDGDDDSEERTEVEREINLYNRRFSGQPRPFLDYIRDLPTILRHVWREFFSVGGLVVMFRLRVLLCFVAVLVYLLSPLDILPEAVLGVIGFLDDLVILLLVLVYVTIIYRQIVADRAD